MIAVPGLTLLPSACSALSCSPRYPPRIAYFSHSLHLSEKHLLNFVLSSPLINILYGYMSFHLSNQKCFFFLHILYKFNFVSSIHHQNHSWLPWLVLFYKIQKRISFLSQFSQCLSPPRIFSHSFQEHRLQKYPRYHLYITFNFVSSPWQLKRPL